MERLETIDLTRVKVPEIRVSSVLNPEQRALLDSTIKALGTVQDIVVRPCEDPEYPYELVAGKSRRESLIAQGIHEYQVKIVDADESLALIMNITENVARGSWDYIDVAKAIRRLRALGKTDEELEEIFPWRRRWIKFIEDLQDLPGDVVKGVSEGILTPTHVQVALRLPTPEEVHDGLRTAIRLSWPTGTFQHFVRNRVEEIERARARAQAQGGEPVIPPPDPERLLKYHQCTVCGYKKPAETVTNQLACEGCLKLLRYVTSQVGPPEKCMDVLYRALTLYYTGHPPAVPSPASEVSRVPEKPSEVPAPGVPGLSPEDVDARIRSLLAKYLENEIFEEDVRRHLLDLGLSPERIETILKPFRGALVPG